MRQVTHIFYAMAFLFLGSSGEPLNRSEKTPEFNAFQRRMWAGEINLADRETKIVYGRVNLGQALEKMHTPRYKEALKILKTGVVQPPSRLPA